MTDKRRATWITRKNVPMWCLDFSGFAQDHAGLCREIAFSHTGLQHRPPHSVLVAVDLYQTKMTPEIAVFFRTYADSVTSPIRKLALIHVTTLRRLNYRYWHHVVWSPMARFFDDYERAKAWLVGDTH